ncbi:hypothetical protein DPMN_005202 [Dreissena polymorpha]|uniref:Uncharacterized protein n=1 Tax=Dreissena polymorpha TaxID=45954 RepID=A0A9D4MU42_DREPO|nr:hypothetical protein DPMN_005202 [Dreissena polymorpha]
MHGFIPDSDSVAKSDVVPYPVLNSLLLKEADSTTSLQFEGKQKKQVMAVHAKEDHAGKVDYSKQHACIFCGQLDPKIARHLTSKKHRSEELL